MVSIYLFISMAVNQRWTWFMKEDTNLLWDIICMSVHNIKWGTELCHAAGSLVAEAHIVLYGSGICEADFTTIVWAYTVLNI
jgi:hypothetical protein